MWQTQLPIIQSCMTIESVDTSDNEHSNKHTLLASNNFHGMQYVFLCKIMIIT